jgi:acyl-CoA-binding protein
MDDVKQKFEAAAVRSKSLPTQANETLLDLYALYKQATVGDAGGPRPGMFDLVGGAKYDAWAKRAGTTKDEAMRQYVELVERLEEG